MLKGVVLDREDWIEFMMWQALSAPGAALSHTLYKARVRREAVLSAISLCGCAGIAVAGVSMHSGVVFFFGLVVAIVFGLSLLTTLPRILRGKERLYSEIAMQRAAHLNVPPINVRVTKEGVHTELPTGPSFEPWTSYADVVATKRLVISRHYDGRYGCVPKRHIGEGPEFERINGLILRWFREAGGGSIQPAIERLRDSDARCSKCGYSLRGVQQLVCPECGRELDIVDF